MVEPSHSSGRGQQKQQDMEKTVDWRSEERQHYSVNRIQSVDRSSTTDVRDTDETALLDTNAGSKANQGGVDSEAPIRASNSNPLRVEARMKTTTNVNENYDHRLWNKDWPTRNRNASSSSSALLDQISSEVASGTVQSGASASLDYVQVQKKDLSSPLYEVLANSSGYSDLAGDQLAKDFLHSMAASAADPIASSVSAVSPSSALPVSQFASTTPALPQLVLPSAESLAHNVTLSLLRAMTGDGSPVAVPAKPASIGGFYFQSTMTTPTAITFGAGNSSGGFGIGNPSSGSNTSSGSLNWMAMGRVQIPLYLIIFLLAVIGNSLVILTLVQNKRMRTITNVFLLNLAISDLFLGVLCMPFTLVGTLKRDFVFGEFMCKILPFLQGEWVM